MSFRQSLTAEQKCAVVRRFYTCQNLTQIAEEFGVSHQTVSRILDEAGARMNARRTASDAVVAEACKSGKTRAQIAAEFGCSKETVSRIARDFKITMQTGRPRTKTLRHDAFDTLTPESAYFAGFLFADGAVMNDKVGQRTIAMNLAVVDREHVEKFRAFLGSDHTIGTARPGKQTHGGDMATFRVRSDRMAAALERWGMVPVKAERVPVGGLASSRDFWRGMVDGDGSLGINPNGDYPYIELYGQRKILEVFANFLGKTVGANVNVRVKHTTVCMVETMGKTALAAIDLLYRDAPVFLTRKRDHAIQILSR